MNLSSAYYSFQWSMLIDEATAERKEVEEAREKFVCGKRTAFALTVLSESVLRASIVFLARSVELSSRCILSLVDEVVCVSRIESSIVLSLCNQDVRDLFAALRARAEPVPSSLFCWRLRPSAGRRLDFSSISSCLRRL